MNPLGPIPERVVPPPVMVSNRRRPVIHRHLSLNPLLFLLCLLMAAPTSFWVKEHYGHELSSAKEGLLEIKDAFTTSSTEQAAAAEIAAASVPTIPAVPTSVPSPRVDLPLDAAVSTSSLAQPVPYQLTPMDGMHEITYILEVSNPLRGKTLISGSMTVYYTGDNGKQMEERVPLPSWSKIVHLKTGKAVTFSAHGSDTGVKMGMSIDVLNNGAPWLHDSETSEYASLTVSGPVPKP